LLIPAATYFAIGIASTILIFPQTLNSVFLTSFVKTNLEPIIGILKLQEEVVNTPPGDIETWSELSRKAVKLRAGHVAGVMGLDAQAGLLQLEISRGRLGPGDLGMMFKKSKDLGARAYGLASFAVSTIQFAGYSLR
jgi:hypothetical protein